MMPGAIGDVSSPAMLVTGERGSGHGPHRCGRSGVARAGHVSQTTPLAESAATATRRVLPGVRDSTVHGPGGGLPAPVRRHPGLATAALAPVGYWRVDVVRSGFRLGFGMLGHQDLLRLDVLGQQSRPHPGAAVDRGPRGVGITRKKFCAAARPLQAHTRLRGAAGFQLIIGITLAAGAPWVHAISRPVGRPPNGPADLIRRPAGHHAGHPAVWRYIGGRWAAAVSLACSKVTGMSQSSG